MKTLKNRVEIPLPLLVIQFCLALRKAEFEKRIEKSKIKSFPELQSIICTIILSHCQKMP